MLEKLKNLIFKGSEEDSFPYRFALVRVNDVAKEHGIDDDENKEIALFEGGKIKKIMPFTNAHLKSLKNEGIPVSSEIDDTEEFEFDAYGDFGIITYKK